MWNEFVHKRKGITKSSFNMLGNRFGIIKFIGNQCKKTRVFSWVDSRKTDFIQVECTKKPIKTDRFPMNFIIPDLFPNLLSWIFDVVS